MIYILHGEDTLASYNKLQLLLDKYHDYKSIKLDEKSEKEKYYMALFSENLTEENDLIVCSNFISLKKTDKRDLNNIPEYKRVIFWEKKKVNLKPLSGIKNKLIIQEFKISPTTFYFLDSISKDAKQLIVNLNKLSENEMRSLFWHLLNRVYLLILAKLGISQQIAGSINGRPMQDWQWAKISSQARNLNLEILQKIFSGLLKIDFLIKNGKTNLDEKTLISTLFIKYLRT